MAQSELGTEQILVADIDLRLATRSMWKGWQALDDTSSVLFGSATTGELNVSPEEYRSVEGLAVGETVILLQTPSPLLGVEGMLMK